jgi:hypothetical protein
VARSTVSALLDAAPRRAMNSEMRKLQGELAGLDLDQAHAMEGEDDESQPA